ncbi:MAG: LuxR family transcriptional regulator [Paracoccaceae bacterium]|nr:MAG: LuxR family transcriptional regulator [Paracoccaceae bacterium]
MDARAPLTGAPPRPPRQAHARRAAMLAAGIAIQGACAVFFTFDVLRDLVQVGGMTEAAHHMIELVAVVGLVIGSAILMQELRHQRARIRRVEDQLRAASGAFAELMQERFRDWGLTPAEQDVALMAIKGLSIAEIARIRGRAEGTVKAQLNAIYAKAAVSGRAQLISLFVEELLEGVPAPAG